MKLMMIAAAAATLMTPHQLVRTSDAGFRTVPRAAWVEADPADSLYRIARRALTDKEYERAASVFGMIVSRYPKSEYAGDAIYWRGFALYRNGQVDEAVDVLEQQAKRYPKAQTRSDAQALLIQLKGQLAQRGDTEARRDVDNAASGSGRSCDNMEVQLAALDAVQQIDSDRALPLLQRVMARRDACSEQLRKNALFVLAHKPAARDNATAAARDRMLLDVARTDPSAAVRQDAVFYLGQSKSDASVDALEDLLMHSDDATLRKNSLFAVSQMKSDRAKAILRNVALKEDAPLAVRKDAIFYLASRDDGIDELSAGYAKLPLMLRKDVLFYISQRRDPAALDRLIALAKSDPSPEIRKDALFYLGQSKDPRALKALEEIVAP